MTRIPRIVATGGIGTNRRATPRRTTTVDARTMGIRSTSEQVGTLQALLTSPDENPLTVDRRYSIVFVSDGRVLAIAFVARRSHDRRVVADSRTVELANARDRRFKNDGSTEVHPEGVLLIARHRGVLAECGHRFSHFQFARFPRDGDFYPLVAVGTRDRFRSSPGRLFVFLVVHVLTGSTVSIRASIAAGQRRS